MFVDSNILSQNQSFTTDEIQDTPPFMVYTTFSMAARRRQTVRSELSYPVLSLGQEPDSCCILSGAVGKEKKKGNRRFDQGAQIKSKFVSPLLSTICSGNQHL
jgi:hypothetical protein